MKKIIFTILILVTCVASVELGKRLWGPRGTFKMETRDAARAKGDPNAELWITEYLDLQCQDCRKAHGTLKDFMAKHPGKIYYQVRFFPLKAHIYSSQAALGAECAARQKGFWEYEDMVFEKQVEWSVMEDPMPKFERYAAATGLDTVEWKKCTEDPAVAQRIVDEKQKAYDLGVRSTPTFFLKEKQIVGAAGIKEELEKYFGERP